jgi:glycerophosphodiester phosphodiesterase
LDTFHNDKYEFLHRKETELCKRYGLAPHLSVVPNLEEVDHCELKDLLEAFIELRKDLTKLQWYDRANQDAIHRIYAKIEKFSKSIGRSHHEHKSRWLKSQLACETQCLNDIERLNKLVADISWACSHAQSGSMCRSLYLKNICDQYSPSPIYPSAVYRAIRDDQASTLAKLLEQETLNNGAPDWYFQAFLYSLLHFSMTCQSRRCSGFLLSEALPNNGVVIDHNCLNHLITITGRSNMPADRDDSETGAQGLSDQSHSETGTSMFLQLLDQLGPGQNGILQADDTLGRLPLHYGALYGFTAICQSILNSLQKWGQDSSAAGEAVLSVDSEGYTPLHFAVIRNHPAVASLFLDTLEMNYQTGDEARNQHLRSVLGGLLLVALKSQYDDIVHLLVTSHIDINHRSSLGETALYVAAQIGREDYVKILLKAASGQNANIDVSETVYGWTPLFIACAEGHLAVVELLLQAGASQTILDYLGWTAKEHAAFRGHLAVAETLKTYKPGDPTGGPANTPFKTAEGANYSLRTGHSHIIANLGVMQEGKQVTAVDLNCYSSEHTQCLHRDTRFSIEVSAPGGSGSSRLVQLPILDDMINEPFVFPIKNPSEAQLMFKIFCATPAHGKKGILVGSGTTLLESHKHCFGANRESLIRERTVPILERETMNFMGTVTFTFVIAKPFMHLNTPPSINYPIKEADPVQLVGHRGIFSTYAFRR